MNAVFLDTSGLVAVANSDDQWHPVGNRLWSELVASSSELVTTSLVLIELADGLSRVQHRDLALRIVRNLRASPRVRIVQCDAQLEHEGWDLFSQRMDKEWGMTDCVSICVMQSLEIEAAFTADSHFEQAGFRILIK